MENNSRPKKRKINEFADVFKPVASTAIDGGNSARSNFPTNLSSLSARPNQFQEIRSTDLHLSYCEDYLPKSIADSLFEFCERSIRYLDGAQVRVYGKWHAIPRKQVAFGDDGLLYQFSGTKVAAEKWPEELKELKRLVSEAARTEFNFVLINRYADGNDCIGEHRDDERELDPTTCITSMSLGQCRDFVLRHEARVRKGHQNSSDGLEPIPENVTLPLKHGSLLLMRPPTNGHWYHSLPKRKRALGVRINFTFRKLRTV